MLVHTTTSATTVNNKNKKEIIISLAALLFIRTTLGPFCYSLFPSSHLIAKASETTSGILIILLSVLTLYLYSNEKSIYYIIRRIIFID
jgi:hypothetical protein